MKTTDPQTIHQTKQQEYNALLQEVQKLRALEKKAQTCIQEAEEFLDKLKATQELEQEFDKG